MKKGLLLGAGFSYDLGMPLVAEMTPVFLEMFKQRDTVKFADLFMYRMQQFGVNRPVRRWAVETGLGILVNARKTGEVNYERLLAKFQKMEGIDKPTQSDRDSYYQLFGFLYSVIHHLFCLYQAASYEIIYPINRRWYSEFPELLSDNETWIFSLNHDLYAECLALDAGIPVTYGDTGSIKFPVSNISMRQIIEFGTHEPNSILTQNSFFYRKNGINLVKLHGGISELYYKDKKLCCNLKLNKRSSIELMEDFSRMREMAFYGKDGKAPTGESARVITNIAGELDIVSSSLLTGEGKYTTTSDTKLGEEKLQLFDQVLQDIDELTIIGYSFGDKHINFRISNALLLNTNLRVIIVDPARYGIPECLEQFDYKDRVKRISLSAPLWMHYSKHKTWDVAQIEALKDSKRGLISNKVREMMKSVH